MNRKQAEANVDEQMEASLGTDDLPSPGYVPLRAGARDRPAPVKDQMPADDCTISIDDELPSPGYVSMGA